MGVYAAGCLLRTLSRTGAVARREPLLEAPAPLAPPINSTISLPGGAPVTLRWARPAGSAAGYDLQVASSPFFVPGGCCSNARGCGCRT